MRNTKWLETQEWGHRNSNLIIYAPLVSQHIAKFPKEGSNYPPFSSWETKKKELAKLSTDIPQNIRILNNFPIGHVERSKELAKLLTDILQIIWTLNILTSPQIIRILKIMRSTQNKNIRTLNILTILQIIRILKIMHSTQNKIFGPWIFWLWTPN